MNVVTTTEPSWADILRGLKRDEQIAVVCHRPHEARLGGILCRTQKALNRQGRINWTSFYTKHNEDKTAVIVSRTPFARKTDTEP